MENNINQGEIDSKSIKEIEEDIKKILLMSLDENETHYLTEDVDDSDIKVEMLISERFRGSKDD